MEQQQNDAMRAKRIMRIYNWSRFILLLIFIAILYIGISRAA